MPIKRWKQSNTAVYNLGYHIIWCPKYRRKVLTDQVAIRLKELLQEKAKEIDIQIENMEIMIDHVHLFVKAKPIDSPQFIVGQLKGYSGRILRQEFKQLKSKLPCMWSRSYYCESIGKLSKNKIIKFVEEQKNK